MKKFLSIQYKPWAFHFAMLLIRIFSAGYLLINHGYTKLMRYNEMQHTFYNFLGIGSKTSLVLVIFAEVLCSLFVLFGIFTRLTVIPIIITMIVAIFGAGSGKEFPEFEMAFLYLACFSTILLCGPGKVSVDALISR